MLSALGLSSIESLFELVPAEIRLDRPLDLPSARSPWQLEREFRELAQRNATTLDHLSYLGAGAYEHYIPATVPALAGRGEYLTAYTPYQPEMNQGLLRVLYDFQHMMARLLGLPSASSSVYDGATALAEAAWMACSIKGRHRLLIAETLWPEYRRVLEVYLRGREVEIRTVAAQPQSGQISADALDREIKRFKPAAVLLQTPTCQGVLESLDTLCNACRVNDTLSVISVNPTILVLLRSPGQNGADIAVCEGQPLGLALNAGGPYLGVIATRDEYTMYLPGRIVGSCVDVRGEPALALVHEEREQHVARHKATSHICSNQANCALRVLIYLSALGERGFRRISELSTRKAHYLAERLCQLPGVSLAKNAPYFHEFLLALPCDAEQLLDVLREQRIFGGVCMSTLAMQAEMPPSDGAERQLLVAVTETKSRDDLDRTVAAFDQALGQLSAATENA